jgi:hypothetical protein
MQRRIDKANRMPNYRQTLLIADGRKALAMRERGVAPEDMMLLLGTSRPRLYRAMALCRALDAASGSELDEYNKRKFGPDPLFW